MGREMIGSLGMIRPYMCFVAILAGLAVCATWLNYRILVMMALLSGNWSEEFAMVLAMTRRFMSSLSMESLLHAVIFS